MDHQCRTIVYSIDASTAQDILIERIGRLPLDTSEWNLMIERGEGSGCFLK